MTWPSDVLESPVPFKMSNTTEVKEQSFSPDKLPFMQPELMVRYVTDTGKILPRKYTGFSAKHQRAVTRTLKRARNLVVSL